MQPIMRQIPPKLAKRHLWHGLLSVCLLFSLLAPEAWAAAPAARGGRFALLITIANYPNQQTLPGAQRDMEHARAVAKAAGVPDNNIITVRDR